jgi:hypothetical protein
MSQQLMFDIVLNLKDEEELDIGKLKQSVKEYSLKIKKDEDFEKVRDKLIEVCVVQLKGAHTPVTENQASPPNQVPKVEDGHKIETADEKHEEVAKT